MIFRRIKEDFEFYYFNLFESDFALGGKDS